MPAADAYVRDGNCAPEPKQYKKKLQGALGIAKIEAREIFPKNLYFSL